jgi:hypothetical protein
MRTIQRRRRYVTRKALALLRPVLRYSEHRDGYVLRLVGNRIGPVLRRDRRRGQRPFDRVNRRRRT